MSRSKNAANGVELPYSGVIIGAVVKALNLDNGALKGPTARRLFAGEPVTDHSRAEIFEALGKATIQLGIVKEPVFLERCGASMSSTLGEAYAEAATRWDALLALLQSRSAPIQEPAVAIDGFLRLVVVDLALRTSAFAILGQLDPPASQTPGWARDDCQRDLLRGLAKEAGLTREQLSDRLQRSDTSVDNWLDGKVRPTRRNVAALAVALANNRPDVSARRMERAIVRQLTLAHLADLLVPFISRKRVVELGAAFYRFVRRITEDMEGMNRAPLKENPTLEVVALVHGSAYPSTIPLLEDLASIETDPAWKHYIMAASVS